MKKLHNNIHHIENIDEFYEWCACAQPTIDFALQFNTEDERWVFEDAYANWQEGRFTAIFRLAGYPANPDQVLSIQAMGDKEKGFQLSVIKKNP